MILTPLQKLPKNVRDLDKIIVATGFEWLPKVQKIAQSGHTVNRCHSKYKVLLGNGKFYTPKKSMAFFGLI